MGDILSAVGVLLQALPSWVLALLVLAGGWGAALLARLVVWKLLDLIRFNLVCERTGITEFLRKGQVSYLPSRLAGRIAYWTVLVIAFFQISKILDIKVVTSFSDRLEASAPGVLAALFIVIIGLVIVSFVGNFVMTVARTAAFGYAALLARIVKTAGVVLVVGLALEQMNLSGTIITWVFLILVAALALGLALAFGLGCKDMAREWMQRFLRNLREKGRVDKGSDLEG